MTNENEPEVANAALDTVLFATPLISRIGLANEVK